MNKATRLIKYLAGTVNIGLVFRKPKGGLQPEFAFDASHGLYPDGYGHGGQILKYGRNRNAPVLARSFKLKIMTRSSSESELVTTEDGSTFVVWTTQLLQDMGFPPQKPVKVFQDNLSTIIMAEQGGSFKRTKKVLSELFLQRRFH
jgi:hypothetical protein